MCNTHKRIRGCKPNRELKTITFRDYVIDFCESQVNTRTVTCSVCGEDSLCTSATIDEDYKRCDNGNWNNRRVLA